MKNQQENWSNQYQKYAEKPVYPTEWIIRTIAGGNYPQMKLDKSKYKNSKLLDLSCGDGRNLQLFLNLGFDVYATEISSDITKPLQEKYQSIKFDVGFANKLPFQNNYFDYVVACASCYYLEPDNNFSDNLKEICRILKPDGYFIANIPDGLNSILTNSTINDNGEATIVDDPFKLRNGYRFQIFNNKDDLKKYLSAFFKNINIGIFNDDYYGLIVSGYMFVAQKL